MIDITKLLVKKDFSEITREDIREISDPNQRQIIKEMRAQWLHTKRMEAKKEYHKNINRIREARLMIKGLCKRCGKQKIFKAGLCKKHYDQHQRYMKKWRRKKCVTQKKNLSRNLKKTKKHS